MKIISINVNGIRAAQRKGLYSWLESQDADVICLQEVRALEEQLNEAFYLEGYHHYFRPAEKKGYSGVAIFSKHKPISVKTELGIEIADIEGRYIESVVDGMRVISMYWPSGSSSEQAQAKKDQLMVDMQPRLQAWLEDEIPTVICGDWNIAHTRQDIKNWRGNQKNSGFLPHEREWLTKLFEQGWVDAFRVINQQDHQYTWWSNRGQAWANNTGWRIDYQIVTPDLKDKIEWVDVYRDERFSDHAPLSMKYKGV